MPGWVFCDPNNFKNQYRTMDPNDPGIPAGYINANGSDGATDRDPQSFTPGGASGGFPQYPNTDRTLAKTDLQNYNGSRSPGASNGPY